MEDWHSFGHYYDNTLMAWYKNLTDNWDQLKSVYDESFYRMWSYYLLCPVPAPFDPGATTSGRLYFPPKNVKADMKPSGSLFL
jgi:cyclopropane-fatty-acyl-phospholipid synthase